MMKTAIVLGALIAAGSVAAQAQSGVGVYGMASVGHYSGQGVGSGTTTTQSGGLNSLGGTFGVYDDLLRAGPVALGADVRGIVENSANSTQYGNKIAGFLVGGRLGANAILLPFRPYVQAEVGSIGTNNGTMTNKQYSLAYQVQFGGDFTIVPHVGVRLEYGVGQLTSGSNGGNNHTLQTGGVGLVLRL